MQYVSDTIRLVHQLHLRDVVDVLIVYLITYEVLRLVRGTRAVPMAFGVAVTALLYQLSVLLGLDTLQFVLRNVLIYAPFAVIVLFQSEIRTALTHFGQVRNPFGTWFRRDGEADDLAFDEIVLAATTLSTQKIGGLIVLERSVGLQNYIDSGVKLNANLTYDLLVTVFNPKTPLHDGAVIVRQQSMVAASCFLPLTLNPRLSKDLGTRHRAAIGITEDSDAVAVVISEETGVISFVRSGKITRNLDGARLRATLQDVFQAARAKSQRQRINAIDAKTPAPESPVSAPFAKPSSPKTGLQRIAQLGSIFSSPANRREAKPTATEITPPAKQAGEVNNVPAIKDSAEEYDTALS